MCVILNLDMTCHVVPEGDNDQKYVIGAWEATPNCTQYTEIDADV